jgi:hypothetical protein
MLRFYLFTVAFALIGGIIILATAQDDTLINAARSTLMP